jgi:hypothetical protein
LAVLADRAGRPTSATTRSTLIDQLHRAMLFWKAEGRAGLVHYLHGHDQATTSGSGTGPGVVQCCRVTPRTGSWSTLLRRAEHPAGQIKRREKPYVGTAEPSLFDEREE